jgi:hypothetical protein
MPEQPVRLIQTTLTYEDKSASFIWAEGVGRSALVDLVNTGLLRDPENPPGVKRARLTRVAMDWATRVIDDPFGTKNIVGDNQPPMWVAPLLESKSVIVTRSPPVQTSFKILAQRPNGLVIGAWVGVAAAYGVGAPMLMFLTVPAGMLVCGATAAIVKGLDLGLPEWLSKKMREAPKPKPKAKRAPRKKAEGLTLEARGTVTGIGTPLPLLAAAEEEAHALKDEAKPLEDVEKEASAITVTGVGRASRSRKTDDQVQLIARIILDPS